jgi:hypothetical protein
VLACAVALCAAAPAGAAVPRIPRANVALGALPSACGAKPASAACEDGVVRALDRARHALGLGPYRLPRRFTALSPARQLLVLTNLDRIAYRLAPVAGLLPALDRAAARGAAGKFDPVPPPGLLAGRPRWTYASSWASNFPNALLAYYFWAYADGYPGGNVDCRRPHDAGCWEHRRNLLLRAAPGLTLSMGAAQVRHRDGSLGVALLLAGWDPPAPLAYAYTWARAVADGAGRRP